MQAQSNAPPLRTQAEGKITLCNDHSLLTLRHTNARAQVTIVGDGLPSLRRQIPSENSAMLEPVIKSAIHGGCTKELYGQRARHRGYVSRSDLDFAEEIKVAYSFDRVIGPELTAIEAKLPQIHVGISTFLGLWDCLWTHLKSSHFTKIRHPPDRRSCPHAPGEGADEFRPPRHRPSFAPTPPAIVCRHENRIRDHVCEGQYKHIWFNDDLGGEGLESIGIKPEHAAGSSYHSYQTSPVVRQKTPSNFRWTSQHPAMSNTNMRPTTTSLHNVDSLARNSTGHELYSSCACHGEYPPASSR
ncbi:unnamed protein product [Zymoseptoria tritici ST99CH_1A5]|uniref:Uncharacterized protein n=1 Tax=Zymoseptoria tritici ST99CH_1A5 TaxID=1276529 RepID=A0A1Y6M3F2_ZYMTR|nr:unnamed protein product [Zymoseptoria tritici ST99CH_1A5]